VAESDGFVRAKTLRTSGDEWVFELVRNRGKTADLKLGIEVNDTAFVVWGTGVLGGRGNRGDFRVFRRTVLGLERVYHRLERPAEFRSDNRIRKSDVNAQCQGTGEPVSEKPKGVSGMGVSATACWCNGLGLGSHP